jgi:DNA-binding GntR family transcriptional regulator
MRQGQTRTRAVVTAQEAAISELRERIARGQLRPGEQILQETVAHELELSVVPVREALKILEAEGQVIYGPHRGYFVAQLNIKELTEAYQIRQLLEDEAVARSVPRLGKEDFARMREAIRDIDRHSRRKDIPAVTAANRRFHFTLFEAADMPRLTNFVRILWDATDPYRSVYFTDSKNRHLVNEEHRAVLEAVLAGDADRAVKLLQEHRRNAIESLCETLAADEENTAGAPVRRRPPQA